MNIHTIAEILDTAAHNAHAVEQISLKHQFDLDDAYAIQKASLERRYARGEKLIGVKMGFTSKAKMEQMGVHDMIWGRLTDAMLIENGGSLSLNKYIHPRAEPEICFLVKKKIDRSLSIGEIKDYIEAIAPAIEIIDSRYQNFKFSLEDVIADNCSSTGLVIGAWSGVDTPLNDLEITLEIDQEVVQKGSSNAILGDPWESVVAAARLANQYGQEISAGDYIMAGAATPAVYLKAGQSVSASIQSLGDVAFKVG